MSADAHGKPGDIWTRELLMRQAFDDEKLRIEQAAPIHDALMREWEAKHRAESAGNGYSALAKLVIVTALACVFLLLLWWAS